MEASKEIALAVARIRELKGVVNIFKSEIDELVKSVKDYMGEEVELTRDGARICTYEYVKCAPCFDTKRFEKECPALFSMYFKRGKDTRRFIVL